MKKACGFLLGVEHTSKSQTTMRMSFKNSKNGKAFRAYFVGAEPYFYIIPKGDLTEAKGFLEKVEVKKFDKLLKVVRVDVVEKVVNFEKTSVLKVFAQNPSDVPDLSEASKAYGDRFEYNIPFVKRFIADYYFTPFEEYEVELDEHKIIKSIKPTNSKKQVTLDLLSIDLETHTIQNKIDMKRDAIIMISWATDKDAGVISYEHKFKEKYVESYKNEKEAIEKLTLLVQEKKPDLICTYNGDQFDLPYLKERANKLHADLRLGRTKKLPYSRAAGLRSETSLDGRIHFDVFPVISFMSFIGAFKVTRLKLETVYKEVLGKEKVDVVKSDIATTWDKGASEELDFLARYNKEDAEACQELARYALPLQIEMSKITGNDLFKNSRATAINLVEPVLMKLARDRNEIFRSKPKFEGEGEPIQGAFVKLPEPGVYSNIAVLDFKSLYPSIIISHNLGPDTLNCKCCSDKDAYVSPQGHKFCKKNKSIIADMLSRVLDLRFEIQKQMKSLDKKSKEYQELYNRQWALKILANSTYGLMVNERFRYFSRQAGEAVTAWGQEYIKATIDKAENKNFKVLYGDSLTSERFVTILDENNFVKIKNVEELFNENASTLITKGEKEVVFPVGLKALSVDPKTLKAVWSPLNEVIRHKAEKQIVRVNQKFGETRVTTDHSLMTLKDGKLVPVKPKEMKESKMFKVSKVPAPKDIDIIDVYDVLKSYSYEIKYKNRIKKATVKCDENRVWFGWTNQKDAIKVKRFIKVQSPEFGALCRLLGAYIAEGSASTPETTKSKMGASIACGDKVWLSQLKADYDLLFENAESCIIQSNTNSERNLTYNNNGVSKTVQYQDMTFKLQMMNSLSAVFFKMFCGQKSSGKKLPDFIYHVPTEDQLILLENMIKGDGSHSVNKKLGYSQLYIDKNFSYTTKSLHLISGLSLLFDQLGILATIYYRKSKQVYAAKTCDNFNERLETKIVNESYSGYVYDLNVEGTHTFVDSCGQVLLHNTDSIFLQYEKETDVEAFIKEVNSKLPEKMQLELEDYYPRGIFVSKKHDKGSTGAKKKYAMINKEGKIKIRGFELVRRDWSKFARDTQKHLLEILLKDGDVQVALKYVRDQIELLRGGKVPLSDMVIYTELRKNPEDYAILSPEVAAYKKAVKAGLNPSTVVAYIVTSSGKTVSDRAQVVELAKDYDPTYYIENQVLPSVLKILGEMGISEDDLLTSSTQKGLGGW